NKRKNKDSSQEKSQKREGIGRNLLHRPFEDRNCRSPDNTGGSKSEKSEMTFGQVHILNWLVFAYCATKGYSCSNRSSNCHKRYGQWESCDYEEYSLYNAHFFLFSFGKGFGFCFFFKLRQRVSSVFVDCRRFCLSCQNFFSCLGIFRIICNYFCCIFRISRQICQVCFCLFNS